MTEDDMNPRKPLSPGAMIASLMGILVVVVYAIVCVVWLGYFQQNTQTSKLNYYNGATYGVSNYEAFENRRILLTAVAANILIIMGGSMISKGKSGDFIAIAVGGLMAIVNVVYLIYTIFQDWMVCNQEGSVPNICRDRRFCCIPAYYNNSIHKCPTAATSVQAGGSVCIGENANLKASQLAIDGDYVMFIVFLVISIAASLLIAFFGYLHYKPPEILVNPIVDFLGAVRRRSKRWLREREKRSKKTKKSH